MFSRPIWKKSGNHKSRWIQGKFTVRRRTGKQADASQKWRGHHDFGNGHSILANFIICFKRPTSPAPTKDLWVPMPWLDCVENDQFFSPTKSMSHSGDDHWGVHPQPLMAQWLLPPGMEHTLVVCNLHRQSGGCCVSMTIEDKRTFVICSWSSLIVGEANLCVGIGAGYLQRFGGAVQCNARKSTARQKDNRMALNDYR